MPATLRIPRPIVAVVAVAAIAASLVAAAPASAAPSAGTAPAKSPTLPAFAPVAADDALSRALAASRISDGTYALERAASLFSYRDVAARYGDVARPDEHLATLILRDLAVRTRHLRGEERRRALRILARPDDNEPSRFEDDDPEYGNRNVSNSCATPTTAKVCVHWVSAGAYPGFKHRTTDAFAGEVITTMAHVWDTEVKAFGYRAPKPDTKVLKGTSNGGDARFDVYLANIGSNGLYGYCTSNDAKLAQRNVTTYDFSAYCVLDNDYAEFAATIAPLDALKVTAAHEFFHAIQFAYDIGEDTYLMEGTASWIEDEVYDDVNDNRQYLSASPLSNPTVPLDKGTGFRVYGSWIWFRFLSETFGRNVIRGIWGRADAAAGGPDRYSTQATVLELKSRGRTFGGTFAGFAATNAKPASFYQEGSFYRSAKVQQSRTISGSNRSFSSTANLHHLTSRNIVLKRGSGVAPDARLRVLVDGPPRAAGPQARVALFRSGGGFEIVPVSLNDRGRGTVRVDFGHTVTKAVVVAVNASTRFKGCYQDPKATYSCWGTPVDDRKAFKVAASLIQ